MRKRAASGAVVAGNPTRCSGCAKSRGIAGTCAAFARAMLTGAQQAAIEALSHNDQHIPAPLWLARQAYLPNDEVERRIAAADPDAFWREQGTLVDWIRPFAK